MLYLNRLKKVLTAQAEAEKIRKIGEAEALSISFVGKAEAESMRLKAEAYQQYGDAAKTALVLEALPRVSKLIWTTFIENPQCGCTRSPWVLKALISYLDFLTLIF